jgi:hypothetical protein
VKRPLPKGGVAAFIKFQPAERQLIQNGTWPSQMDAKKPRPRKDAEPKYDKNGHALKPLPDYKRRQLDRRARQFVSAEHPHDDKLASAEIHSDYRVWAAGNDPEIPRIAERNAQRRGRHEGETAYDGGYEAARDAGVLPASDAVALFALTGEIGTAMERMAVESADALKGADIDATHAGGYVRQKPLPITKLEKNDRAGPESYEMRDDVLFGYDLGIRELVALPLPDSLDVLANAKEWRELFVPLETLFGYDRTPVRPRRPRLVCRRCHDPDKPVVRNGRCDACGQYLAKYGAERPVAAVTAAWRLHHPDERDLPRWLQELVAEEPPAKKRRKAAGQTAKTGTPPNSGGSK